MHLFMIKIRTKQYNFLIKMYFKLKTWLLLLLSTKQGKCQKVKPNFLSIFLFINKFLMKLSDQYLYLEQNIWTNPSNKINIQYHPYYISTITKKGKKSKVHVVQKI